MKDVQDLILTRIDEMHRCQKTLTKEVATMRIMVEHRLTKVETRTTVRAAISGGVTSLLIAIATGIAYLMGR